jgi:hypothetical protein
MRMGMHDEEGGRPSHTRAPAMQHLLQRDEGADGDDARVPEAFSCPWPLPSTFDKLGEIGRAFLVHRNRKSRLHRMKW